MHMIFNCLIFSEIIISFTSYCLFLYGYFYVRGFVVENNEEVRQTFEPLKEADRHLPQTIFNLPTYYYKLQWCEKMIVQMKGYRQS